MSDFEQMPMEPEHQENLFIQILQDMEKLDLMSSEFGGLSIPVKILIGVFTSRAAAESYFAVVSSSSGDFCFLALVSVFSLL